MIVGPHAHNPLAVYAKLIDLVDGGLPHRTANGEPIPEPTLRLVP